MQQSGANFLFQGAIGAIIAGAVVAVWFLVVDVAAGQPFYTPARLASIFLGEEFRGPWPRLVVVYSILHFGVFVSLGIAAAWFLEQLHLEPGLLVGAVFGIGVLNAVHYTGLLVTGTNLLTVVPTVHVLGANLLGGMSMMAYLHRARRAESPLGWGVLRRYPILYDGLITGLIGAATVALWFFAADIVARTPFHTPAALGSAILLGASGPSEIQLTVGIIVAYSFIHIAVFAAVGLAFAWLARRVQRKPAFYLELVVVLALLEGLFLGTVGIVSGWVIDSLGWLAISIGNLLAVLSMAAFVWWQNDELRARLVRAAQSP